MAKIHINKDKCKGCYLCIVNCPNNQIKISDKLNIKGVKPAVFLGGKCSGCAMCALICPECIIEVYRETLNTKSETRNKSKIVNSKH